MRTIFCLASGRSGTHFLFQVIRRNATGCTVRHEPYGWNPSMFGRPIYDLAVGDAAAVRKLSERKARVIRGCGSETYVETSHAFLKSWSDQALELFPDTMLVHLVRDPLKVAKSEAYRHELLDRWHVPLCYYRGGDGGRYFRWALTGLEPIFRTFEGQPLTLFQRYVVQWIEIENRAMRLLDRYRKHAECFTLHSPHELNDVDRLAALFDFLGLKRQPEALSLAGRHNRNPRPTIISEEDRRQFDGVLRRLPEESLRIFIREPYSRWDWSRNLIKR
jgi:hypothetical protein